MLILNFCCVSCEGIPTKNNLGSTYAQSIKLLYHKPQ